MLLFALPFLASECFVAFAGWQRGQVPDEGWINLGFLAAQLTLVIVLIVYAKGARGPALALSVFSLSYALFAAFVASMSFTDNWL